VASPEDIAALRDLISEPDDSNGWTDERLGGLLDSGLTLNAAAGKAWVLKAGTFATLVDVSESGSSRKLSDLRKNAMEMGSYYSGLDGSDVVVPDSDRPIVQRIRRGFA
jgi:hypothetical protein